MISSPPRTQFGPKAYEIYIPVGAQIEASVAMGPGGMRRPYPPAIRETTLSSFQYAPEKLDSR